MTPSLPSPRRRERDKIAMVRRRETLFQNLAHSHTKASGGDLGWLRTHRDGDCGLSTKSELMGERSVVERFQDLGIRKKKELVNFGVRWIVGWNCAWGGETGQYFERHLQLVRARQIPRLCQAPKHPKHPKPMPLRKRIRWSTSSHDESTT